MGFLDKILGSKQSKQNQFDNESHDDNDSIPADFEVITVDPDEPLAKTQKRPPVIFENGNGIG